MTSAQAEATLHALDQKKQAIEKVMGAIGLLQGAVIEFLGAYKELYRLDLAGVEDMRIALDAALKSAQSGLVLPGQPPRGPIRGN